MKHILYFQVSSFFPPTTPLPGVKAEKLLPLPKRARTFHHTQLSYTHSLLTHIRRSTPPLCMALAIDRVVFSYIFHS